MKLFGQHWLYSFIVLAIVGCSALPIEQMPSQSFNQRVQFLVMHFTAIDYQRSVNALVKGKHVSSHYLIPERHDPSYPDETLKIFQLVDESKRAWHAGDSFWQGREDINDQSIGIEIVNIPECQQSTTKVLAASSAAEHGENRLCIFPDYDPQQIELLIALSKEILARHPDIGPTQIIGHADITPSRKNDPGPRFPWFQLYKAGIGAWYDTDKVNQYWQEFQVNQPSIALVQRALRQYGYGIKETGEFDNQTLDTLSAFQMHFLPWQVTGLADTKTVATLFALLDKYFPEKNNRLLSLFAEELKVIAKQSQQEITTEKLNQHSQVQGQVQLQLPNQNPSTRVLVNDKVSFKAYAKRGEIIIENTNAKTADIFINGEKISIDQPFSEQGQYQYSLKKRTKTGINTLSVSNVEPKDSQLSVTIAYPTLKAKTAKNRIDFAKVDKLISNDVKQGFPGAVLLVVKDGEVVKNSAYGYRRLVDDNGNPLSSPDLMQTDTLFDLASNSKMFATNFALMKLVSEGRLDVNKPITHYLADYVGGGRETRLVRDLLNHTAGYAPEVQFFQPLLPDGNKNRFYSQDKTTTTQLIIEKLPFEYGRHAKAIYSDTDYLLLGLLVERITKKPLDTFVEQEIYQPLGLQNTLFNPLHKGKQKHQFAATEIQGNTRAGLINFPNIRQQVLQGEVHDEKAFYAMQGVAGHAGLFANAQDLAVLSQLLLNGGGYGTTQVFTEQVLAEFIKPDSLDLNYGLGWQRASGGQRGWHFGPYASNQAYGHTGWTGTVTVIDPVHDLAIILLTNRKHSEIAVNGKAASFKGDEFETGKYGSVITLVYEAILNKR